MPRPDPTRRAGRAARADTRSLLRGGAGNLAVQLALIATNFAVAVALARAFDPASYGVYTFAFNVVIALAALAQLGMPTLIVRETARAEAAGANGRARGVARFGLAVPLGLVALVTLGAAALLAGPAAGVSPALHASLIAGLTGLPAIVLAQWASAVLRGRRRVVLAQVHQLRMFAYGAGVLALVAAGAAVTVTPATVMGVHVAGAWLASLAALGLLAIAGTRPAASAERPHYSPRAWGAALVPLTATALLTMVNTRADTLLLGALASDAALGQYRAAWQAAAVTGLGVTVVQTVLAPYLARYHAQGAHAELQHSLRLGARAALVWAVPVALALTLAGSAILGAVFGPAYAGAAPIAAVLAAGRLTTAALAGASTVLDMAGHADATARATGVAAALNVAGNLALIPAVGATGAALATALSLGAWNLVLAHAGRRRLAVSAGPR